MSDENGSTQKPNYDISKFKLTKILHNNTVRKSIALLGTFPDLSESDQALVIFEKNAFTETEVQTENDRETYFSPKTKTRVEFINNIYGSFQCVPDADLNSVKTTVVYPATEKHVEKYSIHAKHLINETPALYEGITLPYLKTGQFSLDWVYNILEHKQETERIVYEDPDPETGFVLLPDLKWDGRTIETLYLLAIVHKHDIKSLRDLNGSHLSLLKNIRDKGTQAIEEKYGVPPSQLRMYFHYQPSFYHLHVHFNPVGNDAPGIWCEKSHMLETVINNLELVPDYYQRVTIPFVAYEGNKLLDIYDEELSVRKKVNLDKAEADDELKDLLNDDDKLDEKVDEALQSLRAQKESLLTANRSRAESNIEKEPILIELRGKVNELLEEGKTRCASVQEKVSQIKAKSGNVSQETALALLQTAAAESEEESEKLVKDFTESELGLEGFLEAFLTSRKTMHLRKLKSEKMSELMRQPNQRGSMYNNLPSTGFYPQGPQGLVPYPMGPMMPMPRPY